MLEDRATKGDVIILIALIFGSFISLYACPAAAHSIDRFHAMFDMLGGELPNVTIFVLRFGFWLGLLPPLLCAAAWMSYFKYDNVRVNVALSLGSMAVSTMVCATIILGIVLPILEAQKALTAAEY